MRLEVFGKPECAKCRSSKEKLTHLLAKAGLTDTVPLVFFDVDSVEGMAEGAFNDVTDNLPTVILRCDSGEAMGRWEGKVPLSTEVLPLLGAAKGVGAAE